MIRVWIIIRTRILIHTIMIIHLITIMRQACHCRDVTFSRRVPGRWLEHFC
jgi:hypothetical protein